ncbi:MAG TPA: haloacid dehalogenase type II [Planctomycetota bacterium]|nr:haloacid dehalogenase type II [Planctomycetota bacterium]
MIEWGSVRALTFDCYGTLVDWETGIVRDLRRGLAPPREVEAEEWLRLYAEAEAEIESGGFRKYRDVLREAQARVAAKVGARVVDRDALPNGLGSWPPFPDTLAALERLGKRFRLCITSNVDRDLFAATERALGVRFDEVVTADQVRAYKPDPALVREALSRLGLGPDDVVHVAQSLYHDIGMAQGLGLRAVWVDRRGGRPGGATRGVDAAAPDLRVGSLAELATVVERSA